MTLAVTITMNSLSSKVAFDVAQFWVSRAEYNETTHAWEIRHALLRVFESNDDTYLCKNYMVEV